MDRRIDSIKIVDKNKYHESESQGKTPVPKWFLELISNASTPEEVESAIKTLEDSEEEDLCKRKSIHLAKVRIKIIDYERSKNQPKKEDVLDLTK